MKSISERLGVLFLLLLSTGAAATVFVGQASTTRRNLSSASLRSVMSAIALKIMSPSLVLIGFSPISTGIWVPSLRTP